MTHSPGDPVEIVDGPFTGFVGPCLRSDTETGTIVVAVNVFGRETPTELRVEQVRATERRATRRRVRVDRENPEVVTIEYE